MIRCARVVSFQARSDMLKSGRLTAVQIKHLDLRSDWQESLSELLLRTRCHNMVQVRVVLNKSDQVDQQQLMRVYGALMWSLGKVFRSPEVRCMFASAAIACTFQHCC